MLPVMYVPCKFRLYPFADQERALLRALGELKFLWNYALEQRQHAWRKERRSLTYLDQCRDLARWRANDIRGLGRVYGHVAQECLHRLDDAFQHFFRRVAAGLKPGFPRFKADMLSLTYPDANGSAALMPGKNGTHRLHLSMVGDVPIKVHRAPPAGRVKTCTVKREGDRWFAVLTYEVADPAPAPAVMPSAPVGIDLGLTHLAVLSTGETVDAPKFLRASEKRLRRAQRRLSRRQPGSKRRAKQVVKVECLHARVRNQRRDFAHKATTSWARAHDLIAVEDMAIPQMLGARFAKSISDAGWGMLRQMCAYKERNRSGRYVEVPAANTTQTCSKCGSLADPPLTLANREYRCPCGHREDRDRNAAKNIVAHGLAKVAQDMRELTPVETRPPPARKGRRVRSLKREPPRGTRVAL